MSNLCARRRAILQQLRQMRQVAPGRSVSSMLEELRQTGEKQTARQGLTD